ncbi:MAG: PAS domain S-box protein [Candidatus Omnitrophica bacterium]|nr:PAS domain S-box protein [Candidatus Omnitrophota bacterium]
MQESEARYRALFEQAADSIVLIDVETGALVEFNDRAHENLGYTRKEFQKLKLPDFEAIESPEQVAKHIEKIVRKGSDTFETKHRTKSGEIKNILVRSRAIPIAGRNYIQSIWSDITEHKRDEEMLKESGVKLREQKKALVLKNIALSEIIQQIEVEKRKIKDDIAANVNELLLPILAKLKIKKVTRKYVDLLQYHLEELTSSFGRKITEKSVKLTSREIEICSMVKAGLTSKEISELLNISYQTVEKHRRNIRHKVGISNKDINLTSFLHTL